MAQLHDQRCCRGDVRARSTCGLGGPGGTLNVDFGGVNESGTLTVPNTGGWETFQTLTTTVQLSAGQQIMQVDFDSNGATGYVGNFNWLELTAAPIVVSAGSNFNANAGVTATFAGSVSGGSHPIHTGGLLATAPRRRVVRRPRTCMRIRAHTRPL